MKTKIVIATLAAFLGALMGLQQTEITSIWASCHRGSMYAVGWYTTTYFFVGSLKGIRNK